MIDPYWAMHEQRIKNLLKTTGLLLLLATLVLFVPFVEALRPTNESLATWWQRAGAPVAVFAFLAQNKAQYLGALLTPGAFTSAEMEQLRTAYRRAHQTVLTLAVVLTVVGTIVWGYGDLIVNQRRILTSKQRPNLTRQISRFSFAA